MQPKEKQAETRKPYNAMHIVYIVICLQPMRKVKNEFKVGYGILENIQYQSQPCVNDNRS